MELVSDKATCRKHYKIKINQFSDEKSSHDVKISANLLKLTSQLFNNKQDLQVGSYMSLKDEPTLNLPIQWQTSFPKVMSEKSMSFFKPESKGFKVGAFSIQEPSSLENPVSAGELDCILVPGLAFTNEGFRLGRGKGYYDIYLKQIKSIKIGVGYSFSESLWSPEVHDVPMDFVVTEKYIMQVI